MNREDAKELLRAYRPEILDESDRRTKEALALLATDRELRDWFVADQAFHSMMKEQLRGVAPPADLKERILLQQKITRPIFNRRAFVMAAAAASVAIAAGLIWASKNREQQTLAAFQSRMVGFALRQYRMDIKNSDMAAVRQHLSAQGAPATFEPPAGLAQTGVLGGAGLKWQGKPVAMMCFKGTAASVLYLFVLESDSLANELQETPSLESYKGVNVARWKNGSTIYLLVAGGDAAAVRTLLGDVSSRVMRVAFIDARPFEQPVIIRGFRS